jgi:hypothetical protein
MANDKNLPMKRTPDALPDGDRVDYVRAPLRDSSLLGRAVSRFVAILNKKTVDANAAEVRAHSDNVRAQAELADEMLAADRKIANYLYHRDDLIANDHQAHVSAMVEAQTSRQIDDQLRGERLSALDASLSSAAVQRAHDARVTEQTHAAELAQAEWAAARTAWGRDAFEQTLPLRKERIQHLYTVGALDEEIQMLIRQYGRDEQRRNNGQGAKPADHSTSNAAARNAIDQLLVEVDQEIELARATHASDETLSALYAWRARLNAKRAQHQNE